MTDIIIAFDYEALDAETRIVVQQKTGEIKERVGNIARNWIEIGKRLSEVKAKLPYKQWGKWLEAEFGWSQDTAENWMRTGAWLDQNPNSSDSAKLLPQRVLYLLSGKSIPESAREEILRQASEGEHVTASKAQQIIAAYKPTAPEGYVIWYTTHRGTTYHLVKGTESRTACDILTTYLSRKPRDGATYHLCEKCEAKLAAATPVTAGDTPSNEGQALHAAGVDDSTSPDEPVQRKTADGHWITEDGLILRYIPGADRGWCPHCGDYSNFLLVGQDTWACKKCDWRVQDDAIRIWEPEPPAPTPTRPTSSPATLPDNMVADLQEAQRLLRKWWERLPSSSLTRTYVDQALVNVGKAINSAGKAPASAAFGKPAERIHQ